MNQQFFLSRVLVFAIVIFSLPMAISSPVKFETGLFKTKQLIPYSQCLSNKEELQKIISLSLARYRSRIKEAKPGSIFVENLEDEDLGKLKGAGEQIQGFVDESNLLVDALIAYRNESNIDGSQLLPDAFIIFGGGKFDISLGVGAGTSLMAGVVVMPYCLNEIDNATGEVNRTWTVRTSFIGWGGPTGYGVGVGGGIKARIGVAGIWSLDDDFTDPKQFHGFYYGVSKTWSLGPVPFIPVGPFALNWKAGAVKRTSKSVKDSFIVGSMAIDIGVNVGVTTHQNGYLIVSLDSLYDMIFKGSSQEESEASIDEIENQVEQMEKFEQEINESLNNDSDELNDPLIP